MSLSRVALAVVVVKRRIDLSLSLPSRKDKHGNSKNLIVHVFSPSCLVTVSRVITDSGGQLPTYNRIPFVPCGNDTCCNSLDSLYVYTCIFNSSIVCF
jgi:hypothetical protein